VKLLTLSPAGRRILRDVEPAIQRVQDRLLAPLTASEAETIVRLLAKVADVQVAETR
jgi:MarR family transcriptional regulator, lower aerobic nicotinate degradation pathway regulator